ncbi:MAG: Holliday junction branch migration protein RuvA [Clostridia bacterium]|nr:Holliday junction branch migration protein RuvA [Clostridia bacterium]
MIGYIKGNLLHYDGGVVILENNGIGYEITCSAESYVKIVNSGGGAVYTYMAVREDGVSLYGFDNLNEKSMFLKLISVSGVGPKLGMTVLSGMSLSDLAFCIASSDVKSLSSIKGLGKKTAERIILELREAISLTDVQPTTKKAQQKPLMSEDAENAVMALMSLGYTRADSQKAVEKAVESGAVGLENLITGALKNV